MRRNVGLVVASLALILLGDPSRPRGPRCPDREPPCRDVATCNRAASHLEPTCIEDASFENLLAERGERLIRLRRTLDPRVLVAQLEERTTCQLDLRPPEPAARDPIELYQQVRDSVVIVGGLYRCRRCTRWHTSMASGFVISPCGAVVTNYHVVDNPAREAMFVMTSDQRVFPVQQVLAASRADDLAILQVPAEDLLPLPIAGSAAAPVGSAVGVVSHPDGRFYCYTSGIVSRYMKIHSAGQQVDAVAITADYARGSSGAPVFNREGQVVAIVMSTESVYYTEDEEQQRNLQMVFKTCIPAKSLRKLIRAASLTPQSDGLEF